MESNVNFKFLYADLEADVDGETSRLGAEMHSQEGASLYDVIKVHTNDWPTLRGYMGEALRTVEVNMGEDAVMAHVVEDSSEDRTPIGVMFRFTVPDADMGTVPQAKHEIARFVIQYATAKWLERKNFIEQAKPIMSSASDSLTRGIAILRTRRRPSRSDL